VAHTCNLSYSGGRDQEDHHLKPTWANSWQDLYLEKTIIKKGWWSGSRPRPEFKPHYRKKKKKTLQETQLMFSALTGLPGMQSCPNPLLPTMV
jgi:hypothetical protein